MAYPILLCSNPGAGVVINQLGPAVDGDEIYIYVENTEDQVQIYADFDCTEEIDQPLVTGASPGSFTGSPGAIPGYADGTQGVDFYNATRGFTRNVQLVSADEVNAGGTSAAAIMTIMSDWLPYVGGTATDGGGNSNGPSTGLVLMADQVLASDGTLGGTTLALSGAINPTLGASLTASSAVSLPLTIDEGVNDTLELDIRFNGLFTFTVAPGTYTTLADLEAAISAATSGGGPFDSYVLVSDDGDGDLVFTLAPAWAGSIYDGSQLEDTELATDLGVGGASFEGGVDGTGPAEISFVAFANDAFLDVVNTEEIGTSATLVAASSDGENTLVATITDPYPDTSGDITSMGGMELDSSTGDLFSLDPNGQGLMVSAPATITVTLYITVFIDRD